MSFSNRDYLYSHLPARMRRDDAALFLKRALTFFGDTLDEWDRFYETFYQKVNPDTATEDWIEHWLEKLFGWSWFPDWYTVEHKRELYRFFAIHLARRGTRYGIEKFLRAFSIYSTVYNSPLYWGEWFWGEDGWTVTDALGVVVQISHLKDEVNTEVSAFGDYFWGDDFTFDTSPTLTTREIEDLIRFQWPNGQRVMVEYKVRPGVSGPEAWDSDQLIFNEEVVPDEDSGPVIGAF